MATMFVSIASYRDRLCSDTLQSLFENAKHPHRIYVGICQQNDPQDIPCSTTYVSQVRTMTMDAADARGPAHARYLCSQLYRDEDYYFQMDSHCLFVRDWDEKILDMLRLAEEKSPKALLSHYPRDFSDYQVDPAEDSSVTMIRRMYRNDQGVLTFAGAEFIAPPTEPVRSSFVAAGFLFAPRAFLQEVPFDPYLPDLFTGEEILLTLRAFTHGWDVFTPHRNILYHYYTREGEPKFWERDYHIPTDVEWKIKILCGFAEDHDRHNIQDADIRASLDTYGLGQERSLQDFFEGHPVSTQSCTGTIFWIVMMLSMTLLVCAVIYLLKS